MASHKKLPVSAKAEAGEEDIPSAYLCPITLQIMKDPATDPNSGHTFERATILEWLSRGKAINPLTRKQLRSWELVPNRELQKEIVQWKRDHGYPAEEAQEDNVPWYRRKPTDVDEMTLNLPPPLTTSIPSGNVFIQRLMEAQRRDAEFRKRINNMAVRYHHHFNNNNNQNYYNHHQNTGSNNGGHSRFR